MKVVIAPATSNWASIAMAGAQARTLLARVQPDFDISNSVFPHMRIRQGTIGGVAARVARISFTGELQYELSVPARYASSLMTLLLTPAGDFNPRPIGLEAWLRLRLEKGYLHIGSDTNGRTTPLDVGMADIVAKREDDFIGKRSLTLAFATSHEREQLVGLLSLDEAPQVGGASSLTGSLKATLPDRRIRHLSMLQPVRRAIHWACPDRTRPCSPRGDGVHLSRWHPGPMPNLEPDLLRSRQ